jgi:catechol 2,3-dioxygenase-like lactoylglutathione lyase family enzyme
VNPRVTIHTITIGCTDAKVAARFWRDFLGYAIKANHTSSIHLRDPAGLGPDLLLAWTDDAKIGKNRIHLDLRPDDQDGAVERALSLGATRADIGQTGNESWVVLRDPAGNEFCLLQSTSDLVDWEATAGPPTATDLDP